MLYEKLLRSAETNAYYLIVIQLPKPESDTQRSYNVYPCSHYLYGTIECIEMFQNIAYYVT